MAQRIREPGVTCGDCLPGEHRLDDSIAGRKPKPNWTKSLGQYTVTRGGRLHRLGIDRTEADRQIRFLLNKQDMGKWPDLTPLLPRSRSLAFSRVRATRMIFNSGSPSPSGERGWG